MGKRIAGARLSLLPSFVLLVGCGAVFTQRNDPAASQNSTSNSVGNNANAASATGVRSSSSNASDANLAGNSGVVTPTPTPNLTPTPNPAAPSPTPTLIAHPPTPPPTPTPTPTPTPASTSGNPCVDTLTDAYSSYREQVCANLNQQRAAAGLPPFTLVKAISAVTQAYAVDMNSRGVLDHFSANGESPSDRLTAAGIAWNASGENIAYALVTPAVVVSLWMSDAAHRDNILNPEYGHLGVGYYNGYWVTDFTD
ncbi:MAG: hypothetical protein C5B49_10330 [Bdellovibrio sp.]|nr:MAG: hypothetical protein C5B49_10330 [Bdellovibrio sp.]